MNLDEFAARMKRQEIYQGLRLLDGAWGVVRVDGRGFSKLTERAFEKPFDVRFRDLMHETARALVDPLRAAHDQLNLWRHVPEDLPSALRRAEALGLRVGVVSR